MHRRTWIATSAARLVPHPEDPTPGDLARLRRVPGPTLLTQVVTGRLPRTVIINDRRVRIGGRAVRLRVYRPRARTGGPRTGLPLVINFHGGGFVLGHPDQTDWLCARLAAALDAVVVSPAYRLAPEHPAPDPADDACEAADWLLQHAGGFGADPSRAAVMGPSAGGTLAALVALAHRDAVRAGTRSPGLRAQVLLYPATDMTLASPSIDEFAAGPILTRATLDWFGRHYLRAVPGSAPLAADDPRISPIHHADHTDLPPTLVVVAGRDPLRDDGLRYAQVLREAGVECRTEVHPETIHGFTSMPGLCPPALPALTQVTDFLRTHLTP